MKRYQIFLFGARITRHISRDDLAKKIGCTVRALTYWEQGEREPSISNFEKWVVALGYEITVARK